jgi:23S rRNA (cytidine1920-2'-O)/16S rRNA (cytidine1409-2'-O)-methyltransferase
VDRPKPSTPISDDIVVDVDGETEEWVGRGAAKLIAALEAWTPSGLAVAGRRCLDAGASTGGFTQVLLAHGAGCVYAVDVGRGQLVDSLREDPRVVDLSGTTIRGLAPEAVDGPVDLLVADLSFISLRLVLGDLAALTRPGGDLILLVKPQFEVGKGRLGKHGVVTGARERLDALIAVAHAAQEVGLAVRALQTSPIVGGRGNTEYLMWAVSDPSAKMDPDTIRRQAFGLGEPATTPGEFHE